MEDHKVKRVLLISLPAIVVKGEAENNYNISHSFNLGLAYVAGLLRANNFEVGILDCLVENPLNVRSAEKEWLEIGLSDEQILKFIGRFAPDLIGISIPFSYQHYMAMMLVETIKLTFPDIIIVVGGNHVTAVPEKIDRRFIDYLIVGEGEFALLQLINAINQCQPIIEFPGVIPRAALTFPRSPYIHDLDSLPFPAIDLLPLQKIWGDGLRWINMIATRGCVFDCVFCSIHTVTGYAIRRRSVENVIAEIKHWRKVYKVQEIYFEDDNLTTNRQWAKELFRKIAEQNFGIRFYARNGIRADSIDRELLATMKSAGYQDFYIAPESGSQEILDKVIGKKMKLEDCTNAVRLGQEIGIQVNVFFVLGFPGESIKDIEKTILYARYLKKLGARGYWFSLAVPYPGTRLFKQCVENGYVQEDFDYRKLRVARSVINNNDYSLTQLESIRSEIMAELNYPRMSYSEKIVSWFLLLMHNPSLFFRKLKQKLDLFGNKFLNRRIMRTASSILSKQADNN